MSTVVKDLGPVTAYAYAVAGGYTGTEEEFTELLGDLAATVADLESLTVTVTTLTPGSSATASYEDGVLALGIPQGAKGDTGTAATIAVGTVTTVAPTQNASVTNTGSSSAAVFAFSIPRGDGVATVTKTGTSGNVDTYTMTSDRGVTLGTFTVTNGNVSSVNGKTGAVVLDAGDLGYDSSETYTSGSVGAAVSDLKSEISEIDTALDGKYDRYAATETEGLSLDMFDVCPEQYSIYTYDESDTLKHSAVPSGTTWLIGQLDTDIDVCTFKLVKLVGTSFVLSVATNTSIGAIGYGISTTSNNVNIYTTSTTTRLTGIARNPLCRSVAAGDTLKFVKDGTKVALYLLDNGEFVPIAADEFFDVAQWFESTGMTASDVGLGIVTSNSARNDPLINHFTTFSQSGDHFMDYAEVDARLTALESLAVGPTEVDLVLFMGQSNMAGRGHGADAPSVTAGAGFEFRAISDPTKLYPIEEPFGLDENVQDAIYDYLGGSKAKSGDMVPAFVNAYFAKTHCPIVGVSASEGGTRISYWQPDTARDTDAKNRYNAAVTWLNTHGYTIRHRFILWCQGESDGDDGMSKADYETAFQTMAEAWFLRSIERIFVVKIGNYNGSGTTDYSDIMDAQNELCQTIPNIIMASTDFAGMKARGLMKDDFHYTQTAYNEVGQYAGENVAFYVITGKEPTMYDTQDGTLYFTHKN